MGRTKKEIVVETIKCDLCQKELKGDDLVYHSRLQTFCGECFKGVLKTKGKINELQQRIDKISNYLEENRKQYIYQDGLGEDWYFEDLGVFDDLLEILKGGKND